jgi:hypothetical protein
MRIREAGHDDVPAIVALLADDELGQRREDAGLPLAEAYRDAFVAIDADPTTTWSCWRTTGRWSAPSSSRSSRT